MEYRVYEFTETDYHTSNSYTKLSRLVFLHSLHKFDTIYIRRGTITIIWNLVYLRGKGKWRNCWIILILMRCYCVATSYRDAQEGYCNFLIHDKKGFEWINNHLVRLHFPNKISKVTLVIKEIVFHTVIEKIA